MHRRQQGLDAVNFFIGIGAAVGTVASGYFAEIFGYTIGFSALPRSR